MWITNKNNRGGPCCLQISDLLLLQRFDSSYLAYIQEENVAWVGLDDQPCSKEEEVDTRRNDEKCRLQVFTSLKDRSSRSGVCVCFSHTFTLA